MGEYVIGALLFPGWELMDVASPFSVLMKTASSPLSSLQPPPKFITIGKTRDPIESTSHFPVLPTHTFETCPQLRVLLIPGGMGTLVAANDTELLNFLKKQEKSAEVVMSICTGSTILANAGFLKNRKATTNKASYGIMTLYGTDIEYIRDARFIIDGKFITASGVSAGIDAGFHLSTQLFGSTAASTTAQQIRYEPLNSSTDPFAKIHTPQNPWISKALYSLVGFQTIGTYLINKEISKPVRNTTSSVIVCLLLPSFDLLDVSCVLESMLCAYDSHYLQICSVSESVRGGCGYSNDIVDVRVDRMLSSTSPYFEKVPRIVFIPSVNSKDLVDVSYLEDFFRELNEMEGVVILACGEIVREIITSVLKLESVSTGPKGWMRNGKWCFSDNGLCTVTAVMTILKDIVGADKVKEFAILMELNEQLLPSGVSLS